MNSVSRYLDEAYRNFLYSSVNCCVEIKEQPPHLRAEKFMRIEHSQPRLVSPPIPEPQESPTLRGREWTSRTKSFASRASSRGSFSVRRKLNAYNGFQSGGPRKFSIGPPQDFRHVENSQARRPERYRPLELSIYSPGHTHLSPILPHFGAEDVGFARDEYDDLDFPPAPTMHSRSGSSLSFRIPRKPVRSSSISSEWTAHFQPRPESLSAQQLLAALDMELPRTPQPARLRSLTSPPAYERIKSALHEKYELEQRLKDIEEVLEERKSLYFNSRPVSRATTIDRPLSVTSIYAESQEPMPPTLPSFPTRVVLPLADQRPKTAPSRPVHIPTRLKSFTEASAAFSQDLPPPPPLPLVLHAPPAPLPHKKKSFSRVSNWLFPLPHSRTSSLDSVTNTPKPTTPRDGFYQCVELRGVTSATTVSTVSTMESELEAPTLPTAWSPGSYGAEKRDVVIRSWEMDAESVASGEKSLELTRMRTFGEPEKEAWSMPVPVPVMVPGRNSVGVAF